MGTSETCNAGPVVRSKYVQTVHQLCPGVYSFAYDDGMGLLRCSYGQYRVTFYCPGSPADAPAPGGSALTTMEDPACNGAPEGKKCCKAVKWAMQHGVYEHPEWYPGLTSMSSLNQFQKFLHESGRGECPAVLATPSHSIPPQPAIVSEFQAFQGDEVGPAVLMVG